MMTFPVKIGLMLGGVLGSFGLSVIGYQAGMTPTPEFVNGFMVLFSLVPAGFSFIGAMLMLFGYRITDEDAARYAKANAERALRSMRPEIVQGAV